MGDWTFKTDRDLDAVVRRWGEDKERPSDIPNLVTDLRDARASLAVVLEDLGKLRATLAHFEEAARVWLAAEECTDEEDEAAERMHVAAAEVACALWGDVAIAAEVAREQAEVTRG